MRGGKRLIELPPDLSLMVGDTLVLAGTLDQVNGAEASLLKR